MNDITVLILTYNEEIHIERVITNVIDWAKDVFILDSGSHDRTGEIAKKINVNIFYRKFDNYANQRNYAINNLPIETPWILFLDADEYLTDELKNEIDRILPNTKYDGFYIKRRFYFMNKWIKHGAYYPIWLLRLFNKDKAYVQREMNEHIVVEGKVSFLKNDFIDNNKKGLSDWIDKHNRYATFEALQLLLFDKRLRTKEKDNFANLFGSPPQKKRWLRENIWNRLPPLSRPFLFFIYRYFIKLGFLDGKEGMIFHFLHGFWYPFLIDVKYIEFKLNK